LATSAKMALQLYIYALNKVFSLNNI